jgi:hypothetical protein
MATNNTFQDIIVIIVLESGVHIQREVPTFSLATFDNKSISLSLEMTFGP